MSTRPAALTAATSVVWMGELTAFSTMVLEGYIAAPPTMGSFMSPIWAVAPNVVSASAARATDARNVFFMMFSLSILLRIRIPVHERSLHLRGAMGDWIAGLLSDVGKNRRAAWKCRMCADRRSQRQC